MIASQLDLVKEHTTAVRRKKVYHKEGDPCPLCGGVPPEGFLRHGTRGRWFWAVVEGLVHRVRSLITRLRCPLCKRTFTDYPPFAMPWKHYLLPEITRRSRSYVEIDAMSYRLGARENRMAVGYESGNETVDERMLAHTTLWRWVGCLGRLEVTLRKALRLLREKDPSSDLARRPCLVPIWKYRSLQRKRLLQCVLRLFLVESVSLGKARLFPGFATACRWR